MSQEKHAALYIIGKVVTGALGLALLVVFTRILSAEDYGTYAVIAALGNFMAGVVFRWLRNSLVRFGSAENADRPTLLASIGLLFGLIVLATAVMGLTGGFFTSYGVTTALVLCFLGWSQAWFELLQDGARIDFHPIRYGLAGAIRAAASLGLGVVAYWLAGTLNALLLGLAIGYLLGGFLAAPKLIPPLFRVGSARRAVLWEIARYGLPFCLTAGLSIIIASIDRIMLAAMRTQAEVGIYAASASLAEFSISTLLLGITLSAFPRAVRAFEMDGGTAAADVLWKNLKLLMALGLPAVMGLVILSRPVGQLLLGNFEPGMTPYITMICAVASLVSICRAGFLDFRLMLVGKTRAIALIMFSAAVVNIGLNAIYIPLYGAIAAAWSTLAAYVWALCLSGLVGYRLLPWRPTFGDLVKTLACTTIMVAGISILPTELPVLVSIFLGMMAYALAAWSLDLLFCRSQLLPTLTGRVAAQRDR